MNKAKPIGGRGHKAHYKTTVMRVPEPLENAIDKLCDEYRLYPEKFTEPEQLIEKVIDPNNSQSSMPVEDALKKAREILREKKTPKQSIKKMLQVMFTDDKAKGKIDSF